MPTPLQLARFATTGLNIQKLILNNLKPKLILTTDQNWQDNRPIPLEPTRWGKITVNDPKFLKQNKYITQLLAKNHHVASYFNSDSLDFLLNHQHINITPPIKKIISFSKSLENEDKPTSWLINSLLFSPDVYKQVEKNIHKRLLTGTLGPSKDFTKPLTDFLINSGCINQFKRSNKQRVLTFLDPCAGAGPLSYVIAEFLVQNGIDNFQFINADLSAISLTESRRLVKQYYPTLYERYHHLIKSLVQNALSLDQIANNSLDGVFTLRALHEFTQNQVGQLFSSILQKLKSNGICINLDVTREKTIFERASALLPLLGKFSAFSIFMEQYRTKGEVDSNFHQLILEGDPLFAQAGVQSYASGFIKKELVSIAQKSKASHIHAHYGYEPPVGSIFLAFTKS